MTKSKEEESKSLSKDSKSQSKQELEEGSSNSSTSSVSAAKPRAVMAFIGHINEFDFNKDDWECYTERVEQFFLANDVEDGKKASILLTFIGQNGYSVLRDLCQPDKTGSKSYKELVKLMQNHLSPKPSEMAERYKFQQIKQKVGQSLNDFIVCLQRGAKDCSFENRDISLRDQFVVGLSSDSIKKRLFTESSLTFKKAVEIAMSMEAAEANTAAFHQPNVTERIAKLSISRDNSRPSASNYSSKQNPNFKPMNSQRCTCCGRSNHFTNRCKY